MALFRPKSVDQKNRSNHAPVHEANHRSHSSRVHHIRVQWRPRRGGQTRSTRQCHYCHQRAGLLVSIVSSKFRVNELNSIRFETQLIFFINQRIFFSKILFCIYICMIDILLFWFVLLIFNQSMDYCCFTSLLILIFIFMKLFPFFLNLRL